MNEINNYKIPTLDHTCEKIWLPHEILLQAAKLVPSGLQKCFLQGKVSYYSSEYHMATQ